jgi:glycosyltransferase involved in cell wall biosynthesis
MSRKPINILYLSSFGNLWGGQRSLFELVRKLDKSTFCPYVVVPTEGGLADKLQEENIGVSVLELPKIVDWRIHRTLGAFSKLIHLTRRYNVDLIHSDGPRNTFYGGLAAKIRKVPLVWHARASSRDRYDRVSYYLSSKIILVAEALRERFDWIKGSAKFVTIYNGVDVSESRVAKPTVSVKGKYGIRNGSLLITAVGRVEKLKGQKELIEACGKLKDKLRDFYILVAGEIVDESYVKECNESAAELGIRGRITFAGNIDDVSEVLNETDIFVLPSFLEAFPRSLIEAMGAGKAVVATDVGGCSEAVEDHVSGFIVPAGNSEVLADRIHKLATNGELRRKFGSKARLRVQNMFGSEKNVRKTELLYKEIMREYSHDI